MERMDSDDRVVRRRKSLTERLGLKGIGCCGSTWGIMPATLHVMDDEDDSERSSHHHHDNTPPPETASTPACSGRTPGSSGMNLAAALAAERHFRAGEQNSDNEADSGSPNSRPGPRQSRPDAHGLRSGAPLQDCNIDLGSGPSQLRPDEDVVGPRTEPGTPLRMSLMRLLEETEVYEGELMENDEEGVGGETVCCVCMRRKKGAAFIPCGHTFCRVCSRELWVNRGCCPLCNKTILEILDIY